MTNFALSRASISCLRDNQQIGNQLFGPRTKDREREVQSPVDDHYAPAYPREESQGKPHSVRSTAISMGW
ncbi:hypothetical protein N7478_011776 [Penicillium angulare]|uniref:uncharacterized protein n=1 Tax=Penicillium angulare TaxID=116970 RepID=UPI0025402B3A|nr:uncharacterized protein N7478_011776 [Penicillium angulare]KAJ5261181.1 hypothetical protein N7478_011776 [Penicillium angulare]